MVPRASQVENHTKAPDLATDHTNVEEVVFFSKRKPEEELGEVPTA
jgi:hypothetical protein